MQTRVCSSQERGHSSTEKKEKGREGETQREHRHSSLSKSLWSGPIFWESGLNLTAGNRTTVCLQAVTEAQAALRAAPTPHSKSTSLTDGGSDVTGPHIRPACVSCQ